MSQSGKNLKFITLTASLERNFLASDFSRVVCVPSKISISSPIRFDSISFADFVFSNSSSSIFSPEFEAPLCLRTFFKFKKNLLKFSVPFSKAEKWQFFQHYHPFPSSQREGLNWAPDRAPDVSPPTVQPNFGTFSKKLRNRLKWSEIMSFRRLLPKNNNMENVSIWYLYVRSRF